MIDDMCMKVVSCSGYLTTSISSWLVCILLRNEMEESLKMTVSLLAWQKELMQETQPVPAVP